MSNFLLLTSGEVITQTSTRKTKFINVSHLPLFVESQIQNKKKAQGGGQHHRNIKFKLSSGQAQRTVDYRCHLMSGFLWREKFVQPVLTRPKTKAKTVFGVNVLEMATGFGKMHLMLARTIGTTARSLNWKLGEEISCER